MLRLLKSGRYRSQAQLAPVLGYSDRTLRRWWQSYQQHGLSGLLADPGHAVGTSASHPRPGKP